MYSMYIFGLSIGLFCGIALGCMLATEAIKRWAKDADIEEIKSKFGIK